LSIWRQKKPNAGFSAGCVFLACKTVVTVEI
jgi:hypothetical protein